MTYMPLAASICPRSKSAPPAGCIAAKASCAPEVVMAPARQADIRDALG